MGIKFKASYQSQIDGKASKTLPSWTAPTLTNSWVNVGAGFAPAGYYKDDLSIVRLRGLINTGSNGTSAFTLPAGLRPAYPSRFSVVASDGFGQVEVGSDGLVRPLTGTSGFVSLDGISFRAEL